MVNNCTIKFKYLNIRTHLKASPFDQLFEKFCMSTFLYSLVTCWHHFNNFCEGVRDLDMIDRGRRVEFDQSMTLLFTTGSRLYHVTSCYKKLALSWVSLLLLEYRCICSFFTLKKRVFIVDL